MRIDEERVHDLLDQLGKEYDPRRQGGIVTRLVRQYHPSCEQHFVPRGYPTKGAKRVEILLALAAVLALLTVLLLTLNLLS